MPNISLVIPFRNEELFLEKTLQTLLVQDLLCYSAEIILINGMSIDRSRLLAEGYVKLSTPTLTFILLDNPRLKVPYAFNMGIEAASSPVIGFGGAHTLYPGRFLRKAIELLQTMDADVVGGGHDQIISSDPGIISESISCLYLSPIGAGVAPYHRLSLPGYVDTVYGGFYRRKVFDDVGKFNENLARNQDNEFNARVTGAGLRIFYHPDLDTSYVQKASFPSFIARAWNFGSYHPTTWWINPKSFRLRHATPLLWVIYLFVLIGMIWLLPVPFWMYLPVLAYIFLLMISCIYLALAGKSILASLLTIPLFSLYHFIYGLGTLLGFRAILYLPSSRTKPHP